jgi:hypothetical protein
VRLLAEEGQLSCQQSQFFSKHIDNGQERRKRLENPKQLNMTTEMTGKSAAQEGSEAMITHRNELRVAVLIGAMATLMIALGSPVGAATKALYKKGNSAIRVIMNQTVEPVSELAGSFATG